MMKSKSFYAVRVLLCAVCLGALLGGTALAAEFPDVPADASYAKAVAELADKGIITGDENGKFNPNNTITRAETAAIICRLLGVEDEAKALTETSFSDVASSHWAVGYIAKAVELGIINGYGDGNFGPEDKVTYEQVVKMLVCAWGYDNMAEEEGGYPQGYLSVVFNGFGIIDSIPADTTQPAPRSLVAELAYKISDVTKLN